MVCPSCGTDNRAGRRFCSRCGAGLAVRCASCGAENEPDDAFCGDCGAPLAADAAAARPAPAPAPAAERRLVSVLFVDLVDFTAASEKRDAEETRELLSRYFDIARTLIERYGGTVEKFIGDAVMAVWGTPVAQEDDAERAVRAALDLVAAVPELHPALQARAGVLTGEAAVTLGAEGTAELQTQALLSGAHAALLYAEGRYADALVAGAGAAGLAGRLSHGAQGVKQGLVWAVEAALALDDPTRADELLRSVETLPPGLRPPFVEAHAHRFRARMHGDENGFKAAAAGFREYGFPFWLAVTQLEHGEWLVAEGRAAEVEPLLAEARETFERLEAAPWLERADRAAAKPEPPVAVT